MQDQISSFIKQYGLPVVEIDHERNYWLVRTNAGAYFDEFFVDKYIAIGWDELTVFEKFKSKKKDDAIAEEIEEAYPDEQPGRIYGQIHRFLYEMQIGDIVMIPSENSAYIRFGVITSDPMLREISDTMLDEGACPYVKTREVKWIKAVDRKKLDPYLFRMMQSHQTISNANDYSHYIDRTLHSFFVKNGKAYLVIPVNKEGDIPAYDLVSFVNNIVDLVPIVNRIKGIEGEFDKKDLDLKLNVQSPGFAEFFSSAPQLILGVGLVMVIFFGSKFKVKTRDNDDQDYTQIKGILQDRFLEEKEKYEELRDNHLETLEKVKADLPEELKNLLEINKRED